MLTVLPSAFQPTSHTNSTTTGFYTPRFSLEYRPTADIMAYVSAAKGERAGGIGVGSPNVPSEGYYLPETNWTYEIGARTEWFDHRLRLNATAFYTELQNLQVQQASADPTYPFDITGNAGAATALGGELEALGKVNDFITLGLNYAYTDPTFNSGQTAYGVQGCGVTADACGALLNAKGGLNISGHQLPYARKNTGTVTADVDYPAFDSWSAFGHVDVRYEGGAFTDVTERIYMPSYTLVGARIGVENDIYNISLWARNLTDKTYITNVDNQVRISNINMIVPDEGLGRIIGVTARVKFGGAGKRVATETAAYVPPPVVVPKPTATARSYQVFFEFNKSYLTAQAVTIVDTAAKNAGPAKVTEIEVTGHTDTDGSDAYNMRLSRRRAESVAAELEKQGIPSSEIAIFAKGKKDLLVPTADGVKEPQNRRVQIVYAGGPAS